MVSDVLQMSRRPRTERSAVDLNKALPEIVARWRAEMRSRSARAEAVAGAAPPAGPGHEVNANAIRLTVDVARPVIFEPSQLQQVVGNLLDNAGATAAAGPARSACWRMRWTSTMPS